MASYIMRMRPISPAALIDGLQRDESWFADLANAIQARA
jgi:hypothetical protein